MGVVYAIIIIVPSIFFTWLFILHNRLNHIECKMSNLSERQIRIMRCIQPTPDGWKVTGKMKGENQHIKIVGQELFYQLDNKLYHHI